jgi:DNA polymerase III subunit delta'
MSLSFHHIHGQEEVKNTLRHAVGKNHLAHALLFYGQEGGAALSLALAFSNYLLCPNRTPEDACGECDICSKTQKLIHPDLHFVLPYKSTSEREEDQTRAEMFAQWRSVLPDNPWLTLQDWACHAGIESKQIGISVKESRKILYNASLKPFEANKKVIFIWLPELLGNEAANALLKVLEEPNERTQFVLVANDYDRILPTILSRTQLVSVPRFSEEEIAQLLVEQKGLGQQKALQVARLADGNINQAIHLVAEMPDNNLTLFKEWFRLCYAQKMGDLVQKAEEFQGMGKEPQKSLLQFGLGMLRETLIWNYGDQQLVKLTDDEKEFVSNFSKVMQPQKVEKMGEWINEAYHLIERNVNSKMAYLDLSIKISRIIK